MQSELKGLRLKIREDGDDLVATIWVENKPTTELLRAPLSYVSPSGSPAYHAFVDAASAILKQRCDQVAEEMGLPAGGRVKRRRPDYTGEAR